jgi:hypothetical protein
MNRAKIRKKAAFRNLSKAKQFKIRRPRFLTVVNFVLLPEVQMYHQHQFSLCLLPQAASLIK